MFRLIDSEEQLMLTYVIRSLLLEERLSVFSHIIEVKLCETEW